MATQSPVTATGTKGELMLDVGSGSVGVTRAEGEPEHRHRLGLGRGLGLQGDELSIDTGSGDVTGTELQADEISSIPARATST